MISKRIKELRQQTNITQEELGRALGVTTSMIGMYETGARKPSFEVLQKMADFFNVTTDYILGRPNSTNAAPSVSNYAQKSFIKAINNVDNYIPSLLDEVKNMTVNEREEIGYTTNMNKDQQEAVDKLLSSIKSVVLTPVPVLGVIRAGEPIRAEQNIIGYEYLPDNIVKGGDYFGLKVEGDSMSGARINEGDTVIVREQPEVENGEVAVILVDGENATVKKFYKTDTMVTLVPDSNNKEYQPRFIDITRETVKVLGKVVKVIINM